MKKLSKREWFAGYALKGILGNAPLMKKFLDIGSVETVSDVVVNHAIDMADTLIKNLKKKKEQSLKKV